MLTDFADLGRCAVRWPGTGEEGSVYMRRAQWARHGESALSFTRRFATHLFVSQARVFTCGPALAKLIQGAEWADINLPEVFQITEERLARLQAGEKNFKHRM